MKKLLFSGMLMLLLAVLGAQSLNAATRIVRQDGASGAFTTIAAAVAASGGGDTIEIQQFTAPFVVGNMDFRDRTMKCTAAERATLQFDGVGVGFGWLINATLENLNIFGDGVTGNSKGCQIQGGFTIKNCYFKGWTESCLEINQESGYPLTNSSVTDSYLIGGRVGFFLQGAGDPYPVLFDHCTMVAGQFGNVLTSNALDFTNVTIKNSILSTIPALSNAWGVIFIDGSHSSVRSYNCYYQPGDNVSLGTGDIFVNPGFTNAAAGDYTLAVDSPLFGLGEGGSNIGADQTPYTPKTLAVKQDGTGDFTSVGAAVAAAKAGDKIEIQQFTAPFEEAAVLTLHKTAIKCTTAQPATLNIAGPRGFAMVNSSLENINIVGANVGGSFGLEVRGAFSIKKCTIKGWGETCLDIYQDAGAGTTGSVTGTYLIGGRVGFFVNGNGAPADALPILFSHCTMAADQFGNVIAPPGDGSNVTITNSILTYIPALSNALGRHLYRRREGLCPFL